MLLCADYSILKSHNFDDDESANNHARNVELGYSSASKQIK